MQRLENVRLEWWLAFRLVIYNSVHLVVLTLVNKDNVIVNQTEAMNFSTLTKQSYSEPT